jgi:hypothetical protein
MDEKLVARLVEMALAVKEGEPIGALSTGEQIAVALILDRADLFPHSRMRSGTKVPGYTMLEAVDRLGLEWTVAALAAQRKLEGELHDRAQARDTR